MRSHLRQGLGGVGLGIVPPVMNSTLNVGQALFSGQSLCSPSGHFTLTMQTDANLVLRDVNGKAIWASNTATGDIAYAVFQTDLNFVVYGTGTARWASGTTLTPGSVVSDYSKIYLTVQNDGNVVMYSGTAPLWSTNTQGSAGASVVHPVMRGTAVRHRLLSPAAAAYVHATVNTCSSNYVADASQAWDDPTYVQSLSKCAQAAVISHVSFFQDISTAWAAMEKSAGVFLGVEIAATNLGLGGLIDLVGISALDAFLTTSICTALGVTSSTILLGVSVGAAIGSAVGLVIGAAIGAIIGAVVGYVQSILNPPPACNITLHDLPLRGAPRSDCNEYNSNLTAAATWIQSNSDQLMGMTAVCLAKNFNIAVANVQWEAANSGNFGLSYTLSTAGADGTMYGQFYLPGAYELLNRAQLGHATAMANMTPTKLPFWSKVINPVGTSDGLYRDTNTWAPISIENPYGNAIPSLPGTADGAGNTTYGAPQNLFTNDVIWDPCGNGKQSNMPNGIYMLQALYPALTRVQCELVFATIQPAYQQNLQEAQNWANQQCPIPTAAQLGSGSLFNLEASDVAAVLTAWNPNIADLATGTTVNHCPGGGNGGGAVAPTSGAMTVVKGASVIGGLAAIGVALYAAHTGVSVTAAAKTLYSKTKSLVHLPKIRRTRRLRG